MGVQWLTMRLLILLLLLGWPQLGRAEDPPIRFPLQDGDLWVMVGEGNTAQHLHSNYFEAFCFARYPNKQFAFRNSGVGGDTITKAIARFDVDVAAWKPTVVSVELGMNDRSDSVDKYLVNMKNFTAKVKGIKARPVFLSPNPENNGDTLELLQAPNKRLADFTVALRQFAATEQAPFADQFHQLVDIWGKNKPREALANILPTLKSMAADDSLEGVEDLRKFLAAQEKVKDKVVSLEGNSVQPGPPGQLMMTAALLKDLGADGFVSSARLKHTGALLHNKGCKVSDITIQDGKLSFDRLDDSLPFPIPDEARKALPLFPTILELSQYTLQVTGLTGDYSIKVNGREIGRVNGAEMEKGVNLTTFAKGPIVDQGKRILAAVAAKEGLVTQWRHMAPQALAPAAPMDTTAAFEALAKQIVKADEAIRAAAKPQTLHFELTPVK
jgi:hypothetical protein